jgi:hypothetical protein
MLFMEEQQIKMLQINEMPTGQILAYKNFALQFGGCSYSKSNHLQENQTTPVDRGETRENRPT